MVQIGIEPALHAEASLVVISGAKQTTASGPHDLAASPFVSFAPAAQTRMTAEEATIASSHAGY